MYGQTEYATMEYAGVVAGASLVYRSQPSAVLTTRIDPAILANEGRYRATLTTDKQQ